MFCVLFTFCLALSPTTHKFPLEIEQRTVCFVFGFALCVLRFAFCLHFVYVLFCAFADYSQVLEIEKHTFYIFALCFVFHVLCCVYVLFCVRSPTAHKISRLKTVRFIFCVLFLFCFMRARQVITNSRDWKRNIVFCICIVLLCGSALVSNVWVCSVFQCLFWVSMCAVLFRFSFVFCVVCAYLFFFFWDIIGFVWAVEMYTRWLYLCVCGWAG